MENQQPIMVRVATAEDGKYAKMITEEMASSAQARGTGISRRSPEYIRRKMEEGKSVIALTPDGEWVGYCYIEVWGHEGYVANSGLIVSPLFRGCGAAKMIKNAIFELSREKYPDAKIFGLTTGLAVMKINSELGYRPVPFSELTDDPQFWKGCQSCINYDILTRKEFKNCLCTGMLYDPAEHRNDHHGNHHRNDPRQHLSLQERWQKFKDFLGIYSNHKSPSQLTEKKLPVKQAHSFLSFWGL